MKKFYIGSKDGNSAISRYSLDFYRLILQSRGYVFFDSSENMTTLLSAISSRDHVHIELGKAQKKEAEILFTMLKAEYNNIAITLHDAPRVRSSFEVRNPFSRNTEKLYGRHGYSLNVLVPYLKRIRAIYVLSRKAFKQLERKYKTSNIHYLPHVLETPEPFGPAQVNSNIIYIHFNDQHTLAYALKLHALLLKNHPGSEFYIMNFSPGPQNEKTDLLLKKYTRNVHYLGYFDKASAHSVFEDAVFVMMLQKNHEHYSLFSESVLYSLTKGKILITDNRHLAPELIENGENGYFMSGNLEKDLGMLTRIVSDKTLADNMRKKIHHQLQRHSPEEVSKILVD
jgi:hypothetical protein